MKLRCEKEYKCPLCKEISNHIEVIGSDDINYYMCPKCRKEMFYSRFYMINISWELNISKKEGKLYHNEKEVEFIKINKNKELVFEYKL